MIDLSIGNPDMPPADFVREEMVHTKKSKRKLWIHIKWHSRISRSQNRILQQHS